MNRLEHENCRYAGVCLVHQADVTERNCFEKRLLSEISCNHPECSDFGTCKWIYTGMKREVA